MSPETKRPRPSTPASLDHRLNVAVLFTSPEATVAAMKTAGALAGSLGARILLFVPQIVPYPLPLESPPVVLDIREERFRRIAEDSPVETAVQIYLCRDRAEGLTTVLSPRSLLVIGGRRRWWPTKTQRLAWYLRRAGHEVIVAETE